MTAAVATALSLHDFAEREPADARLLASLRREDLVESVGAGRLQSELDDLNRPLESALTGLARKLYGRATAGTVERTITAVVDLPMGAIRRHLIAETPLPRACVDSSKPPFAPLLVPPGRAVNRDPNAGSVRPQTTGRGHGG